MEQCQFLHLSCGCAYIICRWVGVHVVYVGVGGCAHNVREWVEVYVEVCGGVPVMYVGVWVCAYGVPRWVEVCL